MTWIAFHEMENWYREAIWQKVAGRLPRRPSGSPLRHMKTYPYQVSSMAKMVYVSPAFFLASVTNEGPRNPKDKRKNRGNNISRTKG